MPDVASQWAMNPQYQPKIQQYRPLLQAAAERQGLPPESVPVMESILGVESRFGTARGLDRPGAAGELGILQQTPAFRAQYNVTNPMDDQQQINAMARYFSDEYARGAPLELIPAGYNAGSSRLRRVVAGKISPQQLPAITQRYLESVQNYIGGGARNGQQFAQQMTGRAPSVAKTLQKFGLPSQRPMQSQSSDEMLFSGLSMPQPNQEYDSQPNQGSVRPNTYDSLSAASTADIDAILGEFADARV